MDAMLASAIRIKLLQIDLAFHGSENTFYALSELLWIQNVSGGLLTREAFLPSHSHQAADVSKSGYPQLTVPRSLYIPQYFIIWQISSGSREQWPQACSHRSVKSKRRGGLKDNQGSEDANLYCLLAFRVRVDRAQRKQTKSEPLTPNSQRSVVCSQSIYRVVRTSLVAPAVLSLVSAAMLFKDPRCYRVMVNGVHHYVYFQSLLNNFAQQPFVRYS